MHKRRPKADHMIAVLYILYMYKSGCFRSDVGFVKKYADSILVNPANAINLEDVMLHSTYRACYSI